MTELVKLITITKITPINGSDKIQQMMTELVKLITITKITPISGSDE